ncbi:MAG TPA: VCBS repeat-containing protein [Tepidisphaeraceae bacterium]|jgi:hypothetical protein
MRTVRHSNPLLETLEQRRLLSFSPAVAYPAASVDPSLGLFVVTADFNNDGKPDLATANGDTISVQLGNGDGSLKAPTLMQNTAPYAGLAVGDFNKDGKTDLVVDVNDPEWDYGVVAVMLGNGQGGFSTTGSAPLVNDRLGELAVGDFNGDGKLDVVSASDGLSITGQSRITLLRGNGDGTFASSASSVSVFGVPLSLATGDFNADGKLDLVVGADQGLSDEGNPNWDTVIVLPGNGQGSFTTPSYRYLLSTLIADVAVADLNADGKPDVVTANTDTDTASVLLGNGDGTLRYSNSASDFAAGDWPSSVALGDFNHDGAPDIVTANSAGDDITILLAHGDGTFWVPQHVPAGPYPRALAMGDFNRDGRPDLAAAGYNYVSDTNTLSVLLNDNNWTIRNYVGPSGGNWSTAGNWSPLGVPIASDFVVNISGKSVILSASATVASLTLTDGASLAVTSNGGRVLRTSALSIDGNSKLDLNDNALILDYIGASPASVIRGYLTSGRNGGTWNGPGLASSSATAAPRRALGYADNTSFATPRTSFAGQSVDATSILIKYTYVGDADLDGDTDGVDIGSWAINFTGELSGTGSSVWSRGDWDYDGDVDGVDAGLWATAFTGELGGSGLGSLVINYPTLRRGHGSQQRV